MIVDDTMFRQSVIIMRNKDDKMDREGQYWTEEERLCLQPRKKRKSGPRQPKCLCCNCKLDPAFCPRNQPPMPMQEVPQC